MYFVPAVDAAVTADLFGFVAVTAAGLRSREAGGFFRICIRPTLSSDDTSPCVCRV